MSAPVLRTARLVLRPPAPADLAELARLANDLGVTRMTSRMPYPYALADAELFLERVGLNDPRTDVTWVVADAAGPLGVIGFFSDAPEDLGPELGYWIGRRGWGRGLASEAVGAVVAWSDAVWGKPCLVARCFADNPPSIRVLEKAGFLPTGVAESHHSLARGGEAPGRGFIRMA